MGYDDVGTKSTAMCYIKNGEGTCTDVCLNSGVQWSKDDPGTPSCEKGIGDSCTVDTDCLGWGWGVGGRGVECVWNGEDNENQCTEYEPRENGEACPPTRHEACKGKCCGVQCRDCCGNDDCSGREYCEFNECKGGKYITY